MALGYVSLKGDVGTLIEINIFTCNLFQLQHVNIMQMCDRKVNARDLLN